jgi:L-alanine-DL-glutamate epimerase-like enolase superfamily enzyme
MAIASIEVIPYALPFREPYVTARGTLTQREMVLLRVRTDDGLQGLGEAVPLSLRGGATLARVVADLRRLQERRAWWDQDSVVGWANGMELLNAGGSAPAKAAWAMATRDLMNRENGDPYWRGIGGTRVEPVRCNATISSGSTTAVLREVEAWAAEGFSTFKLKVGPENGLATAQAVREAIGPEMQIRLDANGSWSVDDAIRHLSASDLHLELVEEPVHGIEQQARVKKATDVPIAADETASSDHAAEDAVARRACDLVTVKLSKFGFGGQPKVPQYLSSSLDGPVGIAAAAHQAQVLRETEYDAGIAHGLATQRLFAATIAAVECELRGDELHLPPGPGLGVEIDEAALERHRL